MSTRGSGTHGVGVCRLQRKVGDFGGQEGDPRGGRAHVWRAVPPGPSVTMGPRGHFDPRGLTGSFLFVTSSSCASAAARDDSPSRAGPLTKFS